MECSASTDLPDAIGNNRLLECVGTQFLHRFLNRLDVSYPFLDNVKPFSRFLQTFGLSALHPQYGTLKAAAAMWSLLQFIGATRIDQIGDLLGISELDHGEGSRHPLRRYVATMNDEEMAALRSCLHKSNAPLIDQPLEMEIATDIRADACMALLAEHPGDYDYVATDRPELLGFAGPTDTLTLANAFFEDESTILRRAAERLLARKDVDLVVMGHTHEALTRPNGIMYYNTGCWIPNFELQLGVRYSWALLERWNRSQFPYALTYLEIPNGYLTEVGLRTHVVEVG